jgi:hypothetical protein
MEHENREYVSKSEAGILLRVITSNWIVSFFNPSGGEMSHRRSSLYI